MEKKRISVIEFDDFDKAMAYASETKHQFGWVAPRELESSKKLAVDFGCKFLVTESLELYQYHNKNGYNYMTKVSAISSLTNNKANICILKKDGTLIVTNQTINCEENNFKEMASKEGLDNKLIHMMYAKIKDIDTSDTLIWSKEVFSPSSYHKKNKKG